MDVRIVRSSIYHRTECALHMHELLALTNKIDSKSSLGSDTYLKRNREREKNFYSIRI